jgi:glycosyltransferase involved in cell wall biosynthesis
MKPGEANALAPVSAVIPAYRAKATIAGAIESVAAQTMRPREVIVVDDGSCDGTADIVRTLASRYEPSWLKLLILDHNEGAASARNAGWATAQGEYVAFLDADDTWHPQKLEIQYGYLRSNPKVAICGHRFVFFWDKSVKSEELPKGVESISPLQILMSNPFVTPSVMVRADVPFRFQTGKRHMEDHLLWMEIALAGFDVVRLSEPLAVIRKSQFGESGLSADLWAMEKGELHNYWFLFKSGRATWLGAMGLIGYSLAKYVRRLLIVAARRVAPRAKRTNG